MDTRDSEPRIGSRRRSDEGEIEEDVRQIQASEILPIGQVEEPIDIGG